MTHPKLLNILIILTFTLVTTCSCQAQERKSQQQPLDSANHNLQSFRKTFWENLPKPNGYVNDYENLFTDIEETTLDSLIRDFEKRTTVQMAVVTIDTMMTSADSLDALTLRIGNVWGVGHKDKNNGVVIGICRGYRKMRIQNGYGIEKILSDNETKQIIDTAFIPSFREGKYFEGTFNGLKALMQRLDGKSKITF